MAGSPRIIARANRPIATACRRARVRQGQAFGGAEEAPSLTAAARDGDANMRSRRKNTCGAGRTKEWNDKGRQKWRHASLTNKAPYKPAAVLASVQDNAWAARNNRPLPLQWLATELPVCYHEARPLARS